ncbi:helix-turn-helix domain-containing protein [Pseudochelatococcus sp. B33]
MADDLIAHQQREIETLRERVRQLEDALAPPGVHVPIEWRLTPVEATVYQCLASRHEATKQAIMTALYGTRPDDAPEIKIVDVIVCHIRKKLKPFGIEIRTIWGRGYAIDGKPAPENIDTR